MTWKKLNNDHFGRKNTFGGKDIDKISSVFDGTEDIDVIDINSSTTVRSGKFKFRNPANTFSYAVTPSAITADRVVTMPKLTNNQTFLFQNAVQTMTNKTFGSNCQFDATAAPVSRFAIDTTVMRWGTIFPLNAAQTTTGVAAREGMLSKHTIRNPNGNPTVDRMWPGDWYGYGGQFIRLENTTSNGEWCGIVSPTTGTGLCRMSHDGLIRMRWNQEDPNFASFWCGLSSNASAAPLNKFNPLSSTESGIFIGNAWQSGLWAFEADWHNGNGSSPNKAVIVSGSKLALGSQVFNDLQIKWYHDLTGLHATASVSSSAAGSSVYTISLHQSSLPAESTDLYFHCHLINSVPGDSQVLGIGGIWIESA